MHTTSSLQLSFSAPLSLYNLLVHSSPFPVCWARGARPQGKLLYGQTWLETPDPVRSPKLSNHGRVQYSGGGPPGKRTYCTVSITTMSPNTLRSARAQERVWTWELGRHGDTQTGHMENVGWQWFCFQSGFDSCSAYQIKLEQPKHTSPSTPALILPPLSRHTGPHLAWSQASKSPHPFPITDTLLPPP